MNYREAWVNGEIEAGTLVERIEEQSREIERLNNQKCDPVGSFNKHMDYMRRCSELERELAALKAKPSGVVLPERRKWHDDSSESTRHEVEGWNDALAAVARLSQPASAGDERAAFDCWLCSVKGYKAGTDTSVLNSAFMPWRAWQARAALSANHSEQVLVPRVATPEMKEAIWAELDRQGFDSDLVETQSLYFAGIAAAPSAGSQGGDV